MQRSQPSACNATRPESIYAKGYGSDSQKDRAKLVWLVALSVILPSSSEFQHDEMPGIIYIEIPWRHHVDEVLLYTATVAVLLMVSDSFNIRCKI